MQIGRRDRRSPQIHWTRHPCPMKCLPAHRIAPPAGPEHLSQTGWCGFANGGWHFSGRFCGYGAACTPFQHPPATHSLARTALASPRALVQTWRRCAERLAAQVSSCTRAFWCWQVACDAKALPSRGTSDAEQSRQAKGSRGAITPHARTFAHPVGLSWAVLVARQVPR